MARCDERRYETGISLNKIRRDALVDATIRASYRSQCCMDTKWRRYLFLYQSGTAPSQHSQPQFRDLILSLRAHFREKKWTILLLGNFFGASSSKISNTVACKRIHSIILLTWTLFYSMTLRALSTRGFSPMKKSTFRRTVDWVN